MISKLNKTIDYAADTGMVTVLFSSGYFSCQGLWNPFCLGLPCTPVDCKKEKEKKKFSNLVMTFIMLRILLHKSPFLFIQLYIPFLMFSHLVPTFFSFVQGGLEEKHTDASFFFAYINSIIFLESGNKFNALLCFNKHSLTVTTRPIKTAFIQFFNIEIYYIWIGAWL